jgi:hypothetical protein
MAAKTQEMGAKWSRQKLRTTVQAAGQNMAFDKNT